MSSIVNKITHLKSELKEYFPSYSTQANNLFVVGFLLDQLKFSDIGPVDEAPRLYLILEKILAELALLKESNAELGLLLKGSSDE